MHISQNWTTKEQVFPISLQTSEFDTNLLKAPKTVKYLVKQHKQKGHILDKSNKDNNKCSLFDNIIMDIFLFIAAIISLLATIAIIHLVCKHTKLKALVTGIAFHPIKQTEAAIISLLATIAIIHLVCKHTKLKALVTGIAFHPIKQTEAAIISLLATIAIIHLVCKHTKLKALVTGIAFHLIKQTEALLDKKKTYYRIVQHNGIQ